MNTLLRRTFLTAALSALPLCDASAAPVWLECHLVGKSADSYGHIYDQSRMMQVELDEGTGTGTVIDGGAPTGISLPPWQYKITRDDAEHIVLETGENAFRMDIDRISGRAEFDDIGVWTVAGSCTVMANLPNAGKKLF